MSKSESATKIVFWLAFGAFLAMSVPHVAWVFRFYEPHNDGYDLAWWAMSYGVAISIDVLICWLSYTRSEQTTSKGDGVITWTFIFLLALLSWYCNWLFAESMIGTNVWSISLGWGWTIGTLTPLIVSAIPVFMIAYTYMSRRILGVKSASKSVQELEQEANELEAKLAAKQRINSLRNQHNSSWISGKIQMFKHAVSPEDVSTILEQNTDTGGANVQEDVPERVANVMRYIEQHPIQEIELPEEHKIDLIPDKYFMTFPEAVLFTGYAESTLKKQLKSGEIKANKNGDKLKVSSLKIKGNTAHMPAIQVDKVPATNGIH